VICPQIVKELMYKSSFKNNYCYCYDRVTKGGATNLKVGGQYIEKRGGGQYTKNTKI